MTDESQTTDGPTITSPEGLSDAAPPTQTEPESTESVLESAIRFRMPSRSVVITIGNPIGVLAACEDVDSHDVTSRERIAGYSVAMQDFGVVAHRHESQVAVIPGSGDGALDETEVVWSIRKLRTLIAALGKG